MAVGVCCCCPAQCGGVARALLIPLQWWRVLLSCRALSRCLVCGWCVGGECVSVVFVWWGILCPLPPHVGGGWGHCGWWVASWMVDGMVSEGRLCYWPPRRMSVSPVCVLTSPFRLLSGPVEWRVWWVAYCPPVSCCPLSSSQCSPSSNWIRRLVLSGSLCVAFSRVVLPASVFVFAVIALLV